MDGTQRRRRRKNDADVDSKAGIQFVGWFDIQHFGGGGCTLCGQVVTLLLHLSLKNNLLETET